MDTISRISRIERAALAAGLAALLVAIAPAPAWAHAFPDRSEPRVGETLATAPPTIRVWFDGTLEPVFSTLRVEDADGRQVDTRDARVSAQDGRLLEVSVPSLPPGRYRVFWSVIARDGHRTEGDFPFRVK